MSLTFNLAPRAKREVIVKLPSPAVAGEDLETLLRMDYGASRRQTLDFWSGCLMEPPVSSAG